MVAELAPHIQHVSNISLVPVQPGLGAPLDSADADAALANLLGPDGMGTTRALEVYHSFVVPNCNPQGDLRSLAYVPNAPCAESVLLDSLLTGATFMGTSWQEASGAVAAENQALRWLADLIGFGQAAGGTFVAGGTIANVTAMAVAANRARELWPDAKLAVAASSEVHSSIRMAARMLGLEFVSLPCDSDLRLTRASLAVLDGVNPFRICALVASAGTTNVGAIDDLRGVGEWCGANGIWMHVDAAYGGGALTVPEASPWFDGIDLADSVVIDPHKWLFSTLDCSALIYRNPNEAKQLFGQRAAYIESAVGGDTWDPSDYAPHFTRKCRGLPFWFSLVARGSDAIASDVRRGIELARETADVVRCEPTLELVMEPTLSIVVFRRLGWQRADYEEWAARLLAAGIAFVAPTTVKGEAAMRFCFINPETSMMDVRLILATML
jgi:glutamate/tyrosine decarboxylase-like PLP-dependent enzyme